MRFYHTIVVLLALSACAVPVIPIPNRQVWQPAPVIEPKPVVSGQPLVGVIGLNEAVTTNGNAQLGFPDRPGDVPLLIRQVYDANTNGAAEVDEHTLPGWAVRMISIDAQNAPVGKSRLFFTPNKTDPNAGIFVRVPAGRYSLQFFNQRETVSGPAQNWYLTRNDQATTSELKLELKTFKSTDTDTTTITNLAFCASGNAPDLQIEPFTNGPLEAWKCRQKYPVQAGPPQGGLFTSPQRTEYTGRVLTRPYQPVTLSWESDYDTKATLDQGIGEVQGNSVTVRPAFTTTYTLSLKNEYGSSKQSVTVIPSADSRLNPNFGVNGHLLTEGVVIPVGSQSDGKIIAYQAVTQGSDLTLVRLNPNGSLDSSFKAPAIKSTYLLNSASIVQVFQNDTIAACDQRYSKDAKLYFLQADGTPMNGFGNNGALSVPYCNSLGVAPSQYPENEVLLTQQTATGQELLYVNTKGVREKFKLSKTYDQLYWTGYSDQLFALSSTSYRGGTSYFISWKLQRLNHDGTLDPTFSEIIGSGGPDNEERSYLHGVAQMGSMLLLNDGTSLRTYDLDGKPAPSYLAHLEKLLGENGNPPIYNGNTPSHYAMFTSSISDPLVVRWDQEGFTVLRLSVDGHLATYAFYDGAASLYSLGFKVIGAIPTKNGWFISSQVPTNFNPGHTYPDILETPKYVSYMLR